MHATAISSEKEAIPLLLCHDRGPPDPGMACDPIEPAEIDRTGATIL
ncbi:MAG: hypothetical protein LUP97_08720 [Methanoregula sp.]|nr:hypothetical protein [Methanoregula sp.]